MALDRPLRDFLDATIPSLLDPNPISFRAIDEEGVAPVKAACRKATGTARSLRPPLNRNAFLCGCLGFAEGDAVEHLIVGFGNRWRTTTRITALVHVLGTKNRVGIPDQLHNEIRQRIASGHRAEVLLFHNHPPNLLNALFDNLPLASVPDRLTLLRHRMKPEILLKGILGGGGVRFYLGENGYVREFRIPALLSLLDSLAPRVTEVD